MEFRIFDKLLELPLFQGLSRNELTEIADKVRLEFRKEPAGNVLIRQEARFEKLYLLLNGTLGVETDGHNHVFTLTETLTGNVMFEADTIFGLHPRHQHTFRAKTDVQLLCIDKQSIVSHLLRYEIIRFNLLNIISTQAQNRERLLWASRPQTLNGRFAAFLCRRIVRPAGEKTLRIKMEDLGRELGETRLTVSRMLRALQKDGLLCNGRMSITIPVFEKFLLACKGQTL